MMHFVLPKDVKVIYALSNGFQLLEHCLAIHEWVGGEFHLSPNKTEVLDWLKRYKYKVSVTPIAEVEKLTRNPNNIFVVPSGSHGYKVLSKYKNVYFTTHGVSEKNLYLKQTDEAAKSQQFPLQFSRYLRGTYEYSLDYHKKFLEIDETKKTILYAPTQGEFSSISNRLIDILKDMRNEYNVIVKPHALCWELNKQEINYISRFFPIDIELHNIMPFLELMDVFVGDISAATSAATYFHKKPIILIKDQKYTNFSNLLMDEEVVSLITMGDYKNLSTLLKQELANPSKKENARKDYFKLWYPNLDGMEGYRYTKFILENSNVDYKTVDMWEARYEEIL